MKLKQGVTYDPTTKTATVDTGVYKGVVPESKWWYTIKSTPQQPAVNPPQGSAASVFGDMWGETDWEKNYYANLQSTADQPIDEEAIRRQKESEYQAQIDSVNALYADKLNQARIQWQGRLGSSTAMQARGGLLGSDFWAAQTSNVQGYNTEVENLVNAEKQSALNDIFAEIRTNATAEIAAKRKAKEEWATAYLQYLQWATERKNTKTQNAAKRLLAKWIDPKTVSDEELKKLGLDRDDLTISYNELKAGVDKAAATEATQAETTRLDQAKTQAEIDKMNQDMSKNYEVGNKIYWPDGTFLSNSFDVNGQKVYEAGWYLFQPWTNKNLWPATKPWETPTSSSTSTVTPSGNVVTVKIGNKDVVVDSVAANSIQNAMASMPWAIIGSTYRSREEQQRLYEAYQNGTGGRAAAPWTSRHESGMWVDLYSPWMKAPTPEMVATMRANGWVQGDPVNWPYPDDLGHFEYVGTGGGTSGLSELAQSVQKGIITIAQIPAAQRAAVAAELSKAGTQSPKTRELQNSLDLVDTMLQDEDALKSISGWWGGRLPWSGVFSNQLAANQFDQLKGILSLGEREKLKGTGAISDYESKLLANSASALGRNLSEADFKAELEKIRDILSGKYKYYTDWGGQINTWTPPPTGGSTGTGWVVDWAI